MKKVTKRAFAALLLAGLILLGVGLYLVRLVRDGGEWASFYANDSVYKNGVLDRGTVTDRDGTLLAFSNGDLVSLFDRSEGFFRRQLILTTKGKPPDRVDDPDIAEKMCAEMEGIFLWAFAGLQRLIRNDFRFTESPRARHNRELVRRDANNILLFMESEGYLGHGPDR